MNTLVRTRGVSNTFDTKGTDLIKMVAVDMSIDTE